MRVASGVWVLFSPKAASGKSLPNRDEGLFLHAKMEPRLWSSKPVCTLVLPPGLLLTKGGREHWVPHPRKESKQSTSLPGVIFCKRA